MILTSQSSVSFVGVQSVCTTCRALKDAGKWLFRLQFPTPIFSVLACPTANTSCPQPVRLPSKFPTAFDRAMHHHGTRAVAPARTCRRLS